MLVETSKASQQMCHLMAFTAFDLLGILDPAHLAPDLAAWSTGEVREVTPAVGIRESIFPCPDPLSELSGKAPARWIIFHSLRRQYASHGKVRVIAVRIWRGRVDEETADRFCSSPADNGVRLEIRLVIERAPQHLKGVGFIGEGQIGNISSEEHADAAAL
ncbi:hypothetical protein AB0M50_32800 [Nonomuraea fuscirosea]|uniref:hypothetical protein n=1 Tax=Nonomuraea fuscirosea TaxID=1291556 RepID=UPI00344884D7